MVSERIGNRFQIIPYENRLGVHPFSILILSESQGERERFRQYLIQNSIYPAILWRAPKTASKESFDFGNRMLSFHCDARYSSQATEQMCEIINKYD